MARHEVIPRDTEARFDIGELFFSTTDLKGIIDYGNQVFVRVSQFAREQLTGSPHNIIRHPDMPRTVFAVLWEYVQAGKSIVAYVKNMAADGSYYWVCAMVTPIEGGYLSIRLKPSSPLFPIVSKLYTQMREMELAAETSADGRKRGMELSRAHLTATIQSLGFSDYSELMQKILLEEVRSRKEQIGDRAGSRGEHAVKQSHLHSDSGPDTGLSGLTDGCARLEHEVSGLFSRVGAFMELQKALGEEAHFVQKLGGSLKLLALNAQVRAAGLESSGRTLQVVAQQMSDSARSVSVSTAEVCNYMSEVGRVLRAAAFEMATSDLSVEMTADFLAELNAAGTGNATAPDEVRHRIGQLAQVIRRNLDATIERMTAAAEQMSKLEDRIEIFIKEIRTLEILHVTGKVEAVSCDHGRDVSLVFEDVNARTKQAREKLSVLTELVARADVRNISRENVDETLAVLCGA